MGGTIKGKIQGSNAGVHVMFVEDILDGYRIVRYAQEPRSASSLEVYNYPEVIF